MGFVAEQAVGRRTGEGWRGMRSGGRGPGGGGSVADIPTWQNQTLQVRNTCVLEPLPFTVVSHKRIRRTAMKSGYCAR